MLDFKKRKQIKKTKNKKPHACLCNLDELGTVHEFVMECVMNKQTIQVCTYNTI